MKRLVMVATCVALFGTALLGQTVTLFSDDFESYAAGTNLAGQGGWTGCGFIPVGTSSALPTQVARADLGSAGCSGAAAGFAFINHSFSGSIGDNVVTTLSFDAYAPNGSYDAGVFLTDMNGIGLNGVVLDTAFGPVWQLTLYKNGDGTTKIIMPGGTGVPVSFKVVIDVPNQILYVIYDFGSGPQTTSTLSLAGNTTLSQWKTLSIFGDYRFGYPQDQIDNISLTQTSGLKGIDISKSANTPSANFWDSVKSSGRSFVIVDTWMGQNPNTNAPFQLIDADAAHVKTAVYMELNLNPGFVHQPGKVQVGQALATIGPFPKTKLAFMAIAIEYIGCGGTKKNGKPEPACDAAFINSTYPQDSQSIAERQQRILEAVIELQNNNVQPVIYTNAEHWRVLAGNTTAFRFIPLWDVQNDLVPDLNFLFTAYGGWTSRKGKQYDLGPTGDGTTLFGVDVDLDIFDASLFP